jgi:hypothetical protein
MKIFIISLAILMYKKIKKVLQEYSYGNNSKFLIFLPCRPHFALHKNLIIILDQQIIRKLESLFVKQFINIF